MRRSSPTGPDHVAGTHEIVSGAVDVVPDRDEPDGWWVYVNGVPSSYVQLSDPTVLVFEYVRWIGDLIDLIQPGGDRLRVSHLGGAGCTLPRYVAATRPGSAQVVFEVDGALIEVMRQAFGLRRRDGFRLRECDARQGLAGLAADSQDLVIRDAFARDTVPDHLTTVEFARDVRRVLTSGGCYVANVADRAETTLARAEAATLRAVFDRVAMIAEPAQLRGRRYGNVLLLASDDPAGFDGLCDGLARRLASAAVRARVVPPDRVAELTAGLFPMHDPA